VMGERDLPPGWAHATVGDLADYINGRAFKPEEWKTSGKPIVRIQNLNDPTAKFNFSPAQHEEKYLLKNGDLLFAWSASLGAHIWKGGEAWLNQHIFNVVPNDCTTKNFLFYLLKKITADLYVKAHGSGMVHVTKGKFESTEVALPPLAEQHRIVAKIEELFSELDQGVASLKTAREQLKVYRQSLLKNAFEGKLTAAWRAAHRDQLETAATLQQRIAHERQARYQQQLADWQTAGQAGPKPKPPKPLPPLTAEEFAELPELPAGWGWMKLGSLASQITDGEHFRPTTTEQGIPFLSAKDVRADGVSFDAPLFISLETAEKAWARCHPERNDILIVSRGATVGRMCAVNTDQPFCLLGSVILIKVTPATLPAYLLAALRTPFVNKKIVGASGATAQQAIYLRDIQSVPVAVCSLAEQFEIVQELESKLSEADQLDQTLATALQQADALRQSILKKAFHGQLEKQDKNEEPATALLERIRAERLFGMKSGKRSKIG